jgi:Pregnancy-associated plasma protein-A
LYSQNFCLTKSTSSARVNAITAVAAQPCKNYLIRVYIHRINGQTFSNGYTSSIDNTIINTLNTSLNGYGLFFTLSGSRTWFDDTYANSNTTTLALQGLPNNSNNNFQSNAINIYVLPNNSQISGGFVPASNKQIIMIGGTKSVTHCQPSTTTIAYEIATGRVVSHEMGHCFGLLHTFENSGDDGLSDTPIDNVTNSTGGQACVNFSNCQFTGNCGACTLPSNPTTNMNNFMSYTIPNCMAVFSPMQMDVIRNTIKLALAV